MSTDVNLRERLSELYEADTRRGHRFRYGLLIFDLTTVLFIVTTSFLPRTTAVA
jgi:voltage-gated potassium channel